MEFDSKREFAPPTVFLGLLLCPWMWDISSQLFQCLPSYLGFFDLGNGISPNSWSSEVQAPLLTLDMGYLLSATLHSSTVTIQYYTTKDIDDLDSHDGEVTHLRVGV